MVSNRDEGETVCSEDSSARVYHASTVIQLWAIFCAHPVHNSKNRWSATFSADPPPLPPFSPAYSNCTRARIQIPPWLFFCIFCLFFGCPYTFITTLVFFLLCWFFPQFLPKILPFFFPFPRWIWSSRHEATSGLYINSNWDLHNILFLSILLYLSILSFCLSISYYTTFFYLSINASIYISSYTLSICLLTYLTNSVYLSLSVQSIFHPERFKIPNWC